jgi:hypothetical protein
MDTLTIEVTDKRAYKLLKYLEDLHLIRVIAETIKPRQRLSEKYAGKLPEEVADNLQNHIIQSRKEWERSI